MTLSERVKDIPNGTMIALGAKTSFLNIAPKEELVEWLSEDDHKQFMEREVIDSFYDDDLHHGYIVKIKGMESGKYAIRCEVTGGRPSKKFDTFSDECGVELMSRIIACYVQDISTYDIIKKMYMAHVYSSAYAAERRKLLILAVAEYKAKFAEEFLKKNSNTMFSPVSAETLIRYGHLNACMKMKDSRKEILKSMTKTDEEINVIYTLEQQETILNLMCAGYTNKKILETVGKGKNGWGTITILERFRTNFKNRMEAEARKYFRDMEIPSGVEFRQNMTYKGEMLNA